MRSVVRMQASFSALVHPPRSAHLSDRGLSSDDAAAELADGRRSCVRRCYGVPSLSRRVRLVPCSHMAWSRRPVGWQIHVSRTVHKVTLILPDSYDSPGLADLANDIRAALGPSTFVYMIRTNNDSNADQKETLFGNMDNMLSKVAEQLRDLDEFKNGFDAIGLSQGGVFLRGYVERYGLQDGYPRVRNLITLGSPYVCSCFSVWNDALF